MLRPSYFLVLGLSMLLAVSPVFAQSEALQQSDAVSNEAPSAVAEQDRKPASVVIQEHADAEQRITSRQDVAEAILGETAQSATLAAGTNPTPSIDFADTSPSSPMQVDDSSNRRLYYIIGGVLVAGGLAAGILALSDDGDVGIPPPPGRP